MRKLLSTLCCGALWASCAAGVSAQDVLPPEQAFPVRVSADARAFAIDIGSLDGYYLYRERFNFASETEGIVLGEPRLPQGQIYADEFFGEMEIYRGPLSIAIPYTRTGGAVAQASIRIGLQGCADIGLCYPPQRWLYQVALPPPAPSPLVSSLFSAGPADLLAPEDAFVLNARFDRANELTVSWQIAPGYYLYQDQLDVSTATGPIPLDLPEAELTEDMTYGLTHIYREDITLELPPQEGALSIRWQGCQDDGICYAPQSTEIS